MPLVFVGTLPVSGINVGLVSAVVGLNAEVAKLQADLSGLNAALAGQIQVTASFPPNAAGVTAAITGQLNPAAIAASFAGFPAITASANLDLTAKLGIINAQIEVVSEILVPLELGLGAFGIAGWSYAGRAPGFGVALAADTENGFPGFAPDASIEAVIIATENFGSWGSFSESVDTGGTAQDQVAADVENLRFMGFKTGAGWNFGVASVFAKIRLFLAEIEGLAAALEAQIEISLGIGLPDISALLDVGLSIDIGVALDNLINVQTDFGAAITGLQAIIDARLAFIAELNAQLSAGGLAFWTYSGRADGLGASLRDAIQNGVPSGSGPKAVAYGVALAGTASSMGQFGGIFTT